MTPRRRFLPSSSGLVLPSVSALIGGAVARHGVAALLGAGMALGCGSGGGSSSDEGPMPPSGGQTGEESFGCQPVDRDMLAWSERSTLGFSADELLNTLGSEGDARLTWAGGGSTPLTLGLERAATGSVEFQTRDFTSDRTGAEPAREIATVCNDVVAIPITLSFTTADGAFAEEWPVTLLAESRTRVSAYASVDVDDLAGSFSVTQVDPSRFDRVLAIANLTFGDGQWTGTLSGQGISEGSTNADSSSSATPFGIATF
jgi:hypothetical protein